MCESPSAFAGIQSLAQTAMPIPRESGVPKPSGAPWLRMPAFAGMITLVVTNGREWGVSAFKWPASC